MESTCPCCATHIEKLTPEIRLANSGATLDCPNCDTLLIIKDNRLYEFHSYMNKETEGLWPADGKNTGFIELS
jgi:hypothetical protein